MIKTLAAIFLAALLLCPPASGEEITVVTDGFPPHNYPDVSGAMIGPATEVVKATLAEAGLTPKFQLLPWARAYHMAKTQPGILIYTIIYTKERERDFHWIGPIRPDQTSHFYRLASRTDIQVETLEDAKRYKIAATREGMVHHFLLTEGFRIGEELEIVPTKDLALRMLLAGRADLTYGNTQSIGHDIRAIGHSRTELTRLARINRFKLYMALGKKTDPALVERLRAAFLRVPLPWR